MSKFILVLSLLMVFSSCQKKGNYENQNLNANGVKASTTDQKDGNVKGYIKMSDLEVKEFINELKVKPNDEEPLNLLITIGQTDKNWLSPTDLEFLISIMDSKEKAKCIVQAISSFLPHSENMTVGNQAISIIESYIKNEPFPNALYICEIYNAEKIEEIQQWWNLNK